MILRAESKARGVPRALRYEAIRATQHSDSMQGYSTRSSLEMAHICKHPDDVWSPVR